MTSMTQSEFASKYKGMVDLVHFVIRPNQKGVTEEMFITPRSEAHTLVKDYCKANGYDYEERVWIDGATIGKGFAIGKRRYHSGGITITHPDDVIRL